MGDKLPGGPGAGAGKIRKSQWEPSPERLRDYRKPVDPRFQKRVARIVHGWIQESPQALDRMREVCKEVLLDAASRKPEWHTSIRQTGGKKRTVLTQPNEPEQALILLPNRPLCLKEQYTLLIAIHDATLRTLKPIDPLAADGTGTTLIFLARICYRILCGQVARTIDQSTFDQVKEALVDVAKDLGLPIAEIPAQLSGDADASPSRRRARRNPGELSKQRDAKVKMALDFLKLNHPNHISGKKIAAHLGLAESTFFKHISPELRKRGVGNDRKNGYLLTATDSSLT